MEYWSEGDRVYAYWDEDDYFYPATILSIAEEGDIYIRFDTGEEEWTQEEFLDEYAVSADEEVECKSSKDDQYHDVTVLSVDGDRVQVEYADESVEWSTLNRIRFFIEE